MGKAIESKLKAEYPNNIISFSISVPKVIWESQPQSYMNEKSQNVDFCVFEYNTETKFSVEVKGDEEYPVWNGQKVAMEKFRYFFEGKIYMTLPVK